MMIFKREPVLVLGTIQATLGLLVAFGLHLTPEQIGALLATSAAVLSLMARRRVAPTASAQPALPTDQAAPAV